jgi:hypothetical protein
MTADSLLRIQERKKNRNIGRKGRGERKVIEEEEGE